VSYAKLKKLAVDVVDDFTKLDIVAGYFPSMGQTAKFNAKTKLDTIEITAPVRSVMPPRVNKVMAKEFGDDWSDVSAFETVKLSTIGDLIKLCAKHAQETIPAGEPT
jgi:hypothetical protein